MGNFGYAFANINPISKIDEENKRVSYDFFVDTAVVPGNTDQVDLNVSVTERNTGRIMLGAGVSSAEGLMGSFNVS